MSLLSLNSESLQEALKFTSPTAVLLLAAGATLHCSLMCGPLVASMQNLQKRRGVTPRMSFFQHQIGRSMSYSLAGFAAASVGHAIRPNPALVVIFLAFVILMVVAQLFQISIPFLGLQRISAKVLNPLYIGMSKLGRFQPLGVGFLTPLIPCGQLWMVLGFSALASNQLEGAAIALGFSILSAPGVFGFRHLKDWILNLGTKSPAIVRLGLRSLVIFVLALSAVRFSSLIVAQTSDQSRASTDSRMNNSSIPQTCH